LNRRTKLWLKDVQAKVAEAESLCDASTGDCGRLDFKAATRVVEEIGEQYRSFNEHECEDLTTTLEQFSKIPGKVRLSDFYSEGLHGAWNFTETPGYLRALGVLEEASDGTEANVLIPNYVTSRPNCLATSSIYVVCCRSQCETMMSELESAIPTPAAKPHQILDILSKSSDNAANKLLTIANEHEGRVPLHGRAFATWLHETYPRVCPRPHATGVSHLQSDEERALETGSAVITKDVTAVDAANHLTYEATNDSPIVEQAAPSRSRFTEFLCFCLCSSAAAIWASKDVLFDAEGIMYFNQLTGSKKIHWDQKQVQMPTCRLILLSLCLIAIVYSLDGLICELQTASSRDLVLGGVMMSGFAGAAVVARKNMIFNSRKRTELPT